MDFSKKNILVLTDGSQGMVSQVEGLAKKFNLNFKSIQTKLLFPWSKVQPGIFPIFSWIFINNINLSVTPNIIISCGRKSVYLSIFLKKKYENIINIHIQDPKINFKFFDYIVAPQHDNIKATNVISSIGALHKFDKNIFQNIKIDALINIPKNYLISVIIGGNNNHYKFTLEEIKKLIFKIKILKKTNPKYNFLVIFSRRTTNEMKSEFKKKINNLVTVWDEDKINPYTYALKYSKYFIVTSDSTSMISECAYTGKPIYIFHLPFKRESRRIKRFHSQFQELNITKKLENDSYLITWSYKHLNESERIASIIKERIIKEIHES